MPTFSIRQTKLEERHLPEVTRRILAYARSTRILSLAHCTLDPVEFQRAAQCLESCRIHTLTFSDGCEWHSRGQHVASEESTRLLLKYFRKKQVAVNLKFLYLSNLTSNETLVKILHCLAGNGTESSFCWLRELHLRGTGLAGEAAGQAIAAVVENCPQLQVLDLSSPLKLGSNGIRALSRGIQKAAKRVILKQVDLSACCLADEDAAALIYALSNLACLESVDLTRNALLGIASRVALTCMLENTKTLRTLKFGYYFGNLFAVGDVQPFVDSIASSSLEKLDISLYLAHPNILRHVLTALPNNQSLQALAIDGPAVPLLANVLPNFSSLRTLEIRRDFVWTPAVQTAFYKNSSLQRHISVDSTSKHKGDVEAVARRNRALDLWQDASQEERVSLANLLPHILSKFPRDSAMGLSCFLDLFRRGIIES